MSGFIDLLLCGVAWSPGASRRRRGEAKRDEEGGGETPVEQGQWNDAADRGSARCDNKYHPIAADSTAL
jgi:hypothetical protein